MQQEDLQKLLKVRESVLEKYKSLDGSENPSVSMMRQRDVAVFCEKLMSLVDDLLKPYVNFS